MENFIRSQFSMSYKILGIYQIIGSTIGLILLFYLVYNQGFSVVQLLAIDIVMLLFSLYGLICGILCIKLHEMALTLSFVNQALQLLSFGLSGCLYTYTSGIDFFISFDFTNQLIVSLELGIPKMLLQFNNGAGLTFLNINIVALAIIIWIDSIQHKIKTFKLPNELTEIT
jgi:hypothetical protein